MKCPECDLEQPDDSILCEGCGLSFEMWRQAISETTKAIPDPESKMASPASEEDKPASKKENAPKENPAPAKTESSPNTETLEPSQAGSVEKSASGDKKSFKSTLLYAAGVGLLVVLAALAGFFFTLWTPKPASGPAKGIVVPGGTLTPSGSSTPGTGTPTASPQATGTPENSLFNAVSSKSHQDNPTPTFTSIPESIIPPEQPSPTLTAKPAPPAEPPVSSIWADTPTLSPEPASPVDTPVPAATAFSATPISSPPAGVSTQAIPSDILESPEPQKTVTPLEPSGR